MKHQTTTSEILAEVFVLHIIGDTSHVYMYTFFVIPIKIIPIERFGGLFTCINSSRSEIMNL